MKTVLIDYTMISPAVLSAIVEKAYPTAFCGWSDINEDFFEFRVYGCPDLYMLEDLLAEYVQGLT